VTSIGTEIAELELPRTA